MNWDALLTYWGPVAFGIVGTAVFATLFVRGLRRADRR